MDGKMTTIDTHQRRPCGNCPFRTDCPRGWLGRDRMTEIIESESFTCHKTGWDGVRTKQCAGHMLLTGMDNAYARMARVLQLDLELTGRELVFKTEEEAMSHHE